MSTTALRSVLVTGGSAGIGGQLTLSLAQAGFEVFFASRDADRGLALQNRLVDGGQRAHFLRADLSTQDGVVRLAGDLKAALAARGYRGLDGLVNNWGGVYATPRMTSDGVEATFASNFLHSLLLACALLPELRTVGGRIVQMSTGYHHLVRLTNADWTGRRWDCGMNVYGRAKLLSVQVGDVVGSRWAGSGVGWHFADPGMAETPLTRSMGPQTFPWYGRFLVPAVKQIQRRVPLSWCVTSTLRLLTRSDLPAPSGVYVLPGPVVLPRPLVGFNRKAGELGLRRSLGWLRPEYRCLVERATEQVSIG